MNNNEPNRISLSLSLADETFLRWYELTNALSPRHMDAVFSVFRRRLKQETIRSGVDDILTQSFIQCFKDATKKVAHVHTLSRYESIITDYADDVAA